MEGVQPAVQRGLLAAVVALDEPVVQLVEEVSDKALGKRTLYRQLDMTVDDAYEMAVDVMSRAAAHGDGREWPRAFVEKRAPVWTHRD